MADPPLISLRFGSIRFGEAPLFNDVELRLGRGECACLVGRNGCGKSTLMKALAGQIELDEGELFVQPGVQLAYLPQDPTLDPATTARDYVTAEGAPDHRAEAVLGEVALDPDRTLEGFSGGEARKVALARALVADPDVLMLDEPTNHLDLAAIEWLERLIRARNGALLVVSHDRTFLQNVTNRTYWMERGHLRRMERGFDQFDKWSEEVLEAEAKAADRLDTQLAQETRWLLRGVTARRRRNQGRLRKLEEMRATRAALLGRRGRVQIKIDEGEIKSRMVIEAHDIAKSYGEGDDAKTIIGGFSTRVLRGDRIGIIGPNGAGKTTLLRMLTGDLAPDSGKVRIAKHLRTAYFDQHRAALDKTRSLQETLCPGGGDSVLVHGTSRHVRAYLKDFLFDPKSADSPVSSLSGGERNRLLLAKILATPSELLVLDEPTNDLDMDTLDLLQETLAEYAGTLILVSHDRDFLDRTVTSTIAVEGDGRASEYPGGYADYLQQRREETGRAKPQKATTSKPGKSDTPAKSDGPAAARARDRMTYKDAYELEQLPERIAALEEQIEALEATLADPELFTRDRAAFEWASEQLTAVRGELASAEDRWLELEARREELATQ